MKNRTGGWDKCKNPKIAKNQQIKTIITILLMAIVLIVSCVFYHDRIKHRNAFSKTISAEQLKKPRVIKDKTGNKEKHII